MSKQINGEQTGGEQGWESRTLYRVMGDDEPRTAILVTFIPEDKTLLGDTKEIGVGAGIVMNFLQRELSPQMQKALLAMLYSKGQEFFDSTMAMALETVKLQKDIIKEIRPPQEVIDVVVREIMALEEREEAQTLIQWLNKVEGGVAYDYEGEGEGGEEDADLGRGEEGVGEEAADGAP